MHQVQQQTPNKTGGRGCFRCQDMGHWVKDCPSSPTSRSPITHNRSPTTVNGSPITVSSATSDYPSTHCPCGAGFCEIRVSNSKENHNRKYYRCPGKFENHCGHFKWCDSLKKDEILTIQPKKYPFCRCGAGVCRVKIEKCGLDDGNRFFVCPIEMGNGACNFKQRVDDDPKLLLEYLSPEDEMILDDLVMHALEFSPVENQLQMENGLDRSCDLAGGISPGSPRHHLHSDANNISGNTLALEWTTEDDELLLKMGDSEVQNVGSSNRVTNTMQDPIARAGFNLLNMPEDNLPSNNSPGVLKPPKQPSVLNDKLNDQTTEDIFKALEKLSLCLENDFTTVSQSAGLKKYEDKMKERCAFAPLDYLRVDYGLFHLQAIEYIKQATAHACMEQAIKDDSAARELLERYKKEKTRFEEIVRSFCEAGKAYMASQERLITVREKVSRVKDMLSELEDEVLCCEAENANDKAKLLQITKCMSECKESMQNSYVEVEDTFKVL